MSIRRAVPADLPAVADLVERAFAPYVERIGRRPAPMDDDYGAHIARGDAFVGGEGAIDGLVVCVTEPGGLHVLCLAIEPARQGAGLGRALMAHAEAVARERGLPEVRVYTNAAMTESLAFYPRLGYREVDRRVEDGYSRVYFKK
ncbi:MAG TPA: GNAT family N-acetyltransferase [Solirubrobacteraceae bacterium]|jgi:ribosomal protein S18 acetylase RimI-like enzyme